MGAGDRRGGASRRGVAGAGAGAGAHAGHDLLHRDVLVLGAEPGAAGVAVQLPVADGLGARDPGLTARRESPSEEDGMAAADKTVRDLMEDAILVATYGQRSGRFKDNTLFVAIQKASAVPSLDWSSPELIELQAALNAAVQAIEPVNLVDLRSGWTPFPAGSDPGRARALSKFGFVAAAVLLIFLCGYYTVLHKRAGLVLADMASAREEQQAAILNEVFFRLVGLNEDGAGSDLGNPSSLSHVAIREKLQELRAIERKMIENKRDYNEIVVSLVPGQTLYYRVLGMLNPPPSYATEKAAVFGQGGQQGAGAETLIANCASSGLAGAATEAALPAEASPEAKAMTWFIGLVRQQDQLLRQIRCIVGLRVGDRFELADFNASEYYYVNDPANLIADHRGARALGAAGAIWCARGDDVLHAHLSEPALA